MQQQPILGFLVLSILIVAINCSAILQCNVNSYSKISFMLLDLANSQSNGNFQISYYNKDSNLLGRFNVNLKTAGSLASANSDIKAIHLDMLQICYTWISKVRSVKIIAKKDDGVGFQSFSVSAGRNVETLNDFWLDNPVQQLSDYNGRPAFTQKKINF